MPEFERPAKFGQFVAEPLDLKLELGVAGGRVIKVAVLLPLRTVTKLQRSALGLIAGRVRVRRIAGKIETFQWRIPGATLSSKEQPRPFILRTGIQELELSVGCPAILGIHRRRFRAVALANDLDEALAGIDLVAQDLAEVTGLGAEDFLNDRRVTQPCKDGGDAAACLAEFRRDAGDKHGRLVHRRLLPEGSCLTLAVGAQARYNRCGFIATQDTRVQKSMPIVDYPKGVGGFLGCAFCLWAPR